MVEGLQGGAGGMALGGGGYPACASMRVKCSYAIASLNSGARGGGGVKESGQGGRPLGGAGGGGVACVVAQDALEVFLYLCHG